MDNLPTTTLKQYKKINITGKDKVCGEILWEPNQNSTTVLESDNFKDEGYTRFIKDKNFCEDVNLEWGNNYFRLETSNEGPNTLLNTMQITYVPVIPLIGFIVLNIAVTAFTIYLFRKFKK